MKNLVWRAKQAVHAFRVAKPFECTCPICGYTGAFEPYGFPVRPDARCPKCRSLERHREFSLWLRENAGLIQGKKAIHFAPEPAIARAVQPLCSSYVTADIEPGRADLTLDIEQLDLETGSFDLVICSHVLEHVNDAKALRELRRIIAPGGFAILLVPIIFQWRNTFEKEVHSDAERQKYFGQWDHIRRYGSDFAKRVEQAGFTVEAIVPDPEDCFTYGLGMGSVLHLARPA